jgi:predicted house-cleaning noncanonical NTP pyrophosphatase (MazG superfamily)
MNMPTYNKLVRDRIPEIIEQQGKKFTTSILSEGQYISELKKKANEELQEYIDAQNDEEALEELADLLEIIHSLANIHNGTMETVEKIRREKAVKRGGFQEKIFLIEVEDE